MQPERSDLDHADSSLSEGQEANKDSSSPPQDTSTQTGSLFNFGPQGEPLAGFGRGVGMRFVEYYFPKTTTSIRIASGYFSLRAYKLAHSHMEPDIRLEILVGREQAQEAKKSIAHEIQDELGRATKPLYDAVADLLKRIDDGHFRIRRAGELQTSDRRARFHCKFTLCDNTLMWSGSANFTYLGLTSYGNEEQLVLSQDSELLDTAHRFFDMEMSQARDLLEEVKLCLQEWLEMATPFQAYLRALDSLFHRSEQPLGRDGLVPTYFQESVIVRAVQSLLKYDGCLLLVGTGLGKTVIGAETIRRIKATTLNPKIIVLAPKNLAPSWKRQLLSRDITYDFFDISLLFRAEASDDRDNEISRLEKALAECDADSILLVDEAHKYRGVLQQEAALKRKNALHPHEQPRHSRLRERFSAAIERKARILLLTATPFGTSKQDVNSLLSLLPPKNLTTTGSELEWSIKQLTETATVPPVTVLGMYDVLHMACNRGDEEPNGRLYIRLSDRSHLYLPRQIESYRVEYPLPLSQEFAEAFENEALRGQDITYDRFDEVADKNLTGIANTGENNAVTAWLSSPDELRRIVENYRKPHLPILQTDTTINRPDVAKKRKTGPSQPMEWHDRQRLLQPLCDALQYIQTKDDRKLMMLVDLLKKQVPANRKAVIFVRRYTTANYLERHLKNLLHDISIGCTVRERDTESELRPAGERERIIRDFAPLANPGRRHSTVFYDVLICTDADGIGLNMQDANVVINYDLPPSADLLFQRAGRVIRMTKDPDRLVIIYTFLPECSVRSSKLETTLQKVRDTMEERHGKSTLVVGGSILPEGDDPLIIPLARREDIVNLAKQFPMPEEGLAKNAQPLDSHYAIYDRNKEKAGQLPITLLSAKSVDSVRGYVEGYRASQRHIVVFFRWQDNLRILLYNLDQKEIIEEGGAEKSRGILDLIKCDEAEPKAFVSAQEVERAALEATQVWLATHHQQTNEEEEQSSLFRVCAIYLVPNSKREGSLSNVIIHSAPPSS